MGLPFNFSFKISITYFCLFIFLEIFYCMLDIIFNYRRSRQYLSSAIILPFFCQSVQSDLELGCRFIQSISCLSSFFKIGLLGLLIDSLNFLYFLSLESSVFCRFLTQFLSFAGLKFGKCLQEETWCVFVARSLPLMGLCLQSCARQLNASLCVSYSVFSSFCYHARTQHMSHEKI